jgi:chain length determinant protein EpsF
MSIRQFFSVLQARWLTVLYVMLGVVLIVLVVSLLLPKKYIASSTLVIDSKSPDPINGMVMPNGLMPSYIATQIDVIQSERVARGVINRLGLAGNEALKEQWRSDTKGGGDFEAWVAYVLGKNMDVIPSRESSVLTITYEAVDPNFAAAMANAYANSFINTTLELRVEPAKRFSTLFDEQMRQARDTLEKSQNLLSRYQKEKGIVATDERLDVESARLSELSSQLVALQAQSADSSSRRAQSSANSTEVLNNPVVAGLKADLSRQEARLKELQAVYGDAHPQVAQLRANLDELRSRLNAEISRVTSSVSITNTVDLSREGQIRKSLEAQREKVMKLKEQRDEASVLLADVANATRTYEALQTRYAQTALESQSNQTNVSVLKVATPPSEAASPRVLINTAIALVMGLLIGIGTALIRELLDRRVRTNEDFENNLGLPLLGAMPDATVTARSSGISRKTSKLPYRSLPELSAPTKA